MRAASPALAALLDSGIDLEAADLWELTLSGGSVVRWTNADIDLVLDGQTYLHGPSLVRGGISEDVGLQASTLSLTIQAGDSDKINGVDLIGFISARGLDGTNVRLLRAFMPNWQTPPVGALLRYAGRVTSVGSIMGDTCTLTISSWTILLNVNYPPDVYQTGCLNSVYNTRCGLSKSAFQASGNVAAGSLSVSSFASTLSQPTGYFSQGQIAFTSGANAGITRSVRTSAGDGTITLVRGLPSVPAAGDAFTILPGCDLSRGTCLTKFNNLLRHRGYPFVPTPETAL